MRFTRRPHGVLAVLLGVVLCAACSPAGEHDDVTPGLDVQERTISRIGRSFPPPAPGASPEQVVRGFLRAGASADGDYAAAREYLTTAAANSWDPNAGSVIYSPGTGLTVSAAGNQVSITGAVVAQISDDGVYTASAGTTKSENLQITQVDGQWRIASLSPEFGRWLPSTNLDTVLRPLTVYYLSSSRRELVAEQRWFSTDNLATRLAGAQLEPVPRDLIGAARSAIPAGTRLAANSVTVSGGVADVQLVGSAPIEQERRRDLWAQLISTLMQAPEVRSVAVSINGIELELPGVTGPQSSLSAIGFPSPPAPPRAAAVLRDGDRIYVVPPVGTDPADRTPAQDALVPRTDRALAMSLNGGEFASLNPARGGVSRWRGNTRYDVPIYGTAPGRPAYDSMDTLWLSGIGTGQDVDVRLWVLDARGDPASVSQATARPMAVPWLIGRVVREVRPSPRADRVAVLHTNPSGADPAIDVAGVVRDGRTPTGLSEPRRLGIGLRDITSIGWTSDVDVAALAVRAPGLSREPVMLSIGGRQAGITEVPTGVTIASTGGEDNLYVTTSEGVVLRRAGQGWVSLGPGTDIAVPAR